MGKKLGNNSWQCLTSEYSGVANHLYERGALVKSLLNTMQCVCVCVYVCVQCRGRGFFRHPLMQTWAFFNIDVSINLHTLKLYSSTLKLYTSKLKLYTSTLKLYSSTKTLHLYTKALQLYTKTLHLYTKHTTPLH